MNPPRQSAPLTPVKSFYHFSSADMTGRVCQGTACFVARHQNEARWQQACAQTERTYCLGSCFSAPAAASDLSRPPVHVASPESVILHRLARGGAPTLAQYQSQGGYQALEKALRQSPTEIVSEIEAAGLRGRGGAGFPTGKKWRAVCQEQVATKFVIANADEGDPGAYVDRSLMEDDPHALIEALTIAAYAIGAQRGYIYLRQEYPLAHTRLRQAIEEARLAHRLGNAILSHNFSFDIEIVIGQGSYVCGEETALLNAIEGRRPEVRPRPPYPTTHGLWGKPTLVNNVETLASIPWIIRHGATAYRALGFSHSRGTKVVSLNSLFRRPGLYEIEFGIPVRDIVERLGGGLHSGAIKGVIIGGPLAGIIPPHLFDVRFGFEELHAIGASVGHGGVIAFDHQTSLAELLHHVFDFGAYESCGKCTPCRLGSRRIEELFRAVIAGGRLPASAMIEHEEIIAALAATSLCGLGTGLAEFARSAALYYAEELRACFA